jgi:ATP-binding cassette subfamily C (CFTR/MRP) protein 1
MNSVRFSMPQNMSEGEKQRLQLAGATFQRPGLVLLDDFLSALDTKTEALVFRRLLGDDELLRKSNATIVFAIHLTRYDSMVDHVINIDENHVTAWDLSGSPRDSILYESETGFLTVGTTPSPPVVQGSEAATAASNAEALRFIPADQGLAYPDPLCDLEASITIEVQKKIQQPEGDFRDYVYYANSVKTLTMVAFVTSAVYQAVCYYMSQVVLRWWTEDDGLNRALWLPVYLVLSVVNVCFFGCTCWIMFLKLVSDSAANLHKILLDTVLDAPYSFLARTEVCVALNGFS